MKSSFIISAAVNPTNPLKTSNVKWLQIFPMVRTTLSIKEERKQSTVGPSQGGKCSGWLILFHSGAG